jgi:hypothetical protein
MITDFADFCLYVYGLVDDVYPQIRPLLKRPGPAPACRDSELIANCLIGECKGAIDTELLRNLPDARDLFAHLPTPSRFHRRRRQ